MKKGSIVTGLVEYIDFPNKGYVRVEDEDGINYVCVKNAIWGRVVKCAVTKKKHDKIEGNILETVQLSPEEIESPCPHFDVCGGCSYQVLPYERQLELKESQVLKLMDNSIGRLVPDLKSRYEGIIPSTKIEGYRNKMEYTFGDECKDGDFALGMHKRGSYYDIVSNYECRIVDEDYRNIHKVTFEYFKNAEVPFYHKRTHEGILRNLVIRKGGKSGEVLVDLVVSSNWHKSFDETSWNALVEGWKEQILTIKQVGRIVGILLTTNDSLADVVCDEGTQVLYGRNYFEEELLGINFRISPFAFFQNNSEGAEKLYSKVRDYLLSDDTKTDSVVFDLYTGTGTIAQVVSPAAGKVVGVEIVEEAVEKAKETVARNGITNCEFIAGDVLKVIDEIDYKPDYIILDPPRDGIHPKALRKIIDYGVDRIVYVSCKPSSLARDLEVFLASGYELTKFSCVDLFPGTVHVETVCLLSKKAPV